MIRRVLLLIALFACVLVLLLTYRAQRDLPRPLNRVAVWMPSAWDEARARASLEANLAHVHELSPVWYQLDASGDGSINAYTGARDAALVDRAHANSVLVIPLINNHYSDHSFGAQPVSVMLNHPAYRAAHVAILVDETLAYDYDGIDIDYEALDGADREAFSQFIEDLAAALHAHGKLLSVAVHPKASEPGSWDGPQAQDWARIGAAVDRFRVMTYGYHWGRSQAGPIAPLWWMREVMHFATSVVPPDRVYVGIHFYGHDWVGTSSESVVWEDVQTLINAYGVTPQWSVGTWRHTVAEPWFTYTDGAGRTHEVWYANRDSVAARLSLVREYGLGGVAIWRLGGEDPANWSAISSTLQPVGLANRGEAGQVE